MDLVAIAPVALVMLVLAVAAVSAWFQEAGVRRLDDTQGWCRLPDSVGAILID